MIGGVYNARKASEGGPVGIGGRKEVLLPSREKKVIEEEEEEKTEIGEVGKRMRRR